MLQRKNAFNQTMVILAIAASLAACSSPETNTTSTESPVSSPVTNNSPASSPANAVQANVSIPGVSSVEEVKFSQAPASLLNGSFDVLNNSPATSHQIPISANIQAAGWAVIPAEDKPADTVIITEGKTIQ